MRDVLPAIEAWLAEGRRVALATVVDVWGSAPRPLGAKLACAEGGGLAGSVSGGCVEGAVVEAAAEVMAGGRPRLLRYGVDDDTAFSFGLSCGGQLGVWLEPWPSPLSGRLVEALGADKLCGRAFRLDESARDELLFVDGERHGSLGDGELDAAAAGLWSAQRTTLAPIRQRLPSGAELFLDVLPPPPQLVVVGAVHVAIPLIAMAKLLGFRTVVVDPRTAFATPERFGHADLLVHDWPDAALESLGLHSNSFVALLSHDPKLDVPAALVALAHGVRYVGALGARKTHERRVAKLREAGAGDAAIARLHNPIGLDLGGRRAEEIALAVMAQIVAVSHGRDARPAAESDR